MKNLFMISSAIESTHGIFHKNERLLQTIETIKSIRKKDNDACIIVFDSSPVISKEVAEFISSHINVLFLLQNSKEVMHFSSTGLKSAAECSATLLTLIFLKENYKNILSDTKRIFKISGRYRLQDTFNINEYDNLHERYVFRKRIPSWMSEEQQRDKNVDHLLITRLYSLCPSLIDNYIQTLSNVLSDTLNGLDLEHSVYKNIDKNLLIEFDKIHCEGNIALNGSVEID